MTQQKLEPSELKKLSVEELMNIEVSLASRTPQKLTESASAIQVLTGESIRRSGATNIPEALRLVPNVQVAQLTAGAWIISTRGFNTIFANKLLVMIDGRTVYTPLFGGVIWEQQNVMLEDVDRIEIVSGPGGTLWGANAVNGVINIVTKAAKKSQGLYAMASAGSFIKDMAALRYGGKIGEKIFYRVYGQHFDRKQTTLNGTDNTDAWGLTRGGFRMDWEATASDAFTLQGDLYDGNRKTAGGRSPLNGQNILGRWSHTVSDKSDLLLQLYYDRYFRKDIPGKSSDKLKTFDIDFQHRFPLPHQSLLWGTGYRVVKDEALFETTAVGILPPQKNLHLFNAFVQDEITLHEQVKFTIGTKLTHFTYSGFNLQPSARIAWSLHSKSTLWAAVSRAIRAPSRLDVDYYLPTYSVPPTSPSVAGGPNFISEKVTAYELGYRLQPNQHSSFSVATFYNIYHDLYSVEALPGTLTYQIQNGSEGESWGAEFSANYQVAKKWRLGGGYTYFDKDLRAKPGHNFNPDYLGNDVKHMAVLQSILDLPLHLQLDIAARYLSGLPKTIATAAVPSYFTFDSRLAYTFRQFEIAVVGQNLWEEKHGEFGTYDLPRNLYVKISARF